MPDLSGWQERGWQVLYLDADGRKHDLPHMGRGVLTFYGADGKESWAPPADDIRLIWNDEYHVWNLYIPSDSEGSISP